MAKTSRRIVIDDMDRIFEISIKPRCDQKRGKHVCVSKHPCTPCQVAAGKVRTVIERELDRAYGRQLVVGM